MSPLPVPTPVRLAGVAIALEGVAVLVIAVVGLVTGGALSVWGFVLLLAVGLGAAGTALVLGQRGARGPAVVSQLLLLGIAFYAAVPSERPEWGVPLALLAVLVLAGVLGRAGRAWVDEG